MNVMDYLYETEGREPDAEPVIDPDFDPENPMFDFSIEPLGWGENGSADDNFVRI